MREIRPFRAPGFRRTLSAVLLAVLAASAGVASAAAPVLTVTPARADLGEVPVGASGTLEFTLGNAGADDVRVVYLFAECDCSLDLPAQGRAPAGGSWTFAARYHLDEAGPGPWSETITLLTDHPLHEEIAIPISAHVLSDSAAAEFNRDGEKIR